MTVALLLLYIGVIVGLLFHAQAGGIIALIALILDLTNTGGTVG